MPDGTTVTEPGASPVLPALNRPLFFDEFFDWLKSADRQDRVVWYEGYLPIDRHTQSKRTDNAKYKADALGDYARFVMAVYARGDISLTQQKLGKFSYRYFAEKLNFKRNKQ